MLVRMRESPKAQTKLESVNARIQVGERGVRNVHEAKLSAPIVFASQKVHPQCAARGEIYTRRAGRHIVVRKKCSAPEFDVRNDPTRLCKIPFQGEGIQPEAVGGAAPLNHHENGHDIHRVFELAA